MTGRRLTLARLVAEGRFDEGNRTHRALLELEDVPADAAEELVKIQAAYRGLQNRGDRRFLAASFGLAVRR